MSARNNALICDVIIDNIPLVIAHDVMLIIAIKILAKEETPIPGIGKAR